MRRWWLWVGLGLLFGGTAAVIWQVVRRLQQGYDTASTTLMPPLPHDEFVPRDDPAIYFPDPAPTPSTPAPSASDAPIISAPEAVPEPEEINDTVVTSEPPPNLSADDVASLAIETSSPAEPIAESADGDETDDAHDDSDEHEGELAGITGYCVRCRTKREIQEPHVEITESGRRAARGTCPVCGTTIFRFLKDVPE